MTFSSYLDIFCDSDLLRSFIKVDIVDDFVDLFAEVICNNSLTIDYDNSTGVHDDHNITVSIDDVEVTV